MTIEAGELGPRVCRAHFVGGGCSDAAQACSFGLVADVRMVAGRTRQSVCLSRVGST